MVWASAAKMQRHRSCLLPAVPSFLPASFKTILHCLGFESCVTTSSFTVANSLDYFAFSAHKCACALMTVCINDCIKLELLGIAPSLAASRSDFSIGLFCLLIILLLLSVFLSIRAQYNVLWRSPLFWTRTYPCHWFSFPKMVGRRQRTSCCKWLSK